MNTINIFISCNENIRTRENIDVFSTLDENIYGIHLKRVPSSVAHLDAPSDWRPGGRGFNPRRGRQHSFVEIDHEILSSFFPFR